MLSRGCFCQLVIILVRSQDLTSAIASCNQLLPLWLPARFISRIRNLATSCTVPSCHHTRHGFKTLSRHHFSRIAITASNIEQDHDTTKTSNAQPRTSAHTSARTVEVLATSQHKRIPKSRLRKLPKLCRFYPNFKSI